ncbi:MAG TPA: cellulase family glycosylhydrolase [Acidimicrobiia bacterium]
MSRKRPAVAIALAVLLFGGTAIVFAAVAHKGTKHNTAAGPSPGSPVTTGPGGSAVDARPIANLSSRAFGISTGVQLYNESLDKIDADIAGIAALGAHWVRTAVRWDLVEPDRATADDWTTADRIVADARAHDLNLILNVTGTPKWARAPGAGAVEFPSDLQTYATFTQKIASRFAGKVAAYELGNEPNHTKSFANPDPKRYEQVLALSYPLIKAADPQTKVLTGGLGGVKDKNGAIPGDVFLADLYRAGAKPYFDGVSYHPYTYPLLPSNDSGERGWSRMLNARRTMVANGDAAKQIWVTEYGAPTGGPNSVSQGDQSTIMYDAYRLWAGYSWAGPLCWFDYRDKGTDTSDHGNFFGLYSKNGQPKEALAQYQSLVRSAR